MILLDQVVLVSRTRSIHSSTVVYLYDLPGICLSSMSSCEIHRQEGACGPLLGSRCGVAHARRRHPRLSLSCFTAVPRVWRLISSTYLSSFAPATSIYLSGSSAVSSPLSVCCCVSYVTIIHSQPRVASDSTKHTLEGKSPAVVAWITL